MDTGLPPATPEIPPVAPEAVDAALARLREVFGGEPAPEALRLVEERDRAFEARFAAAQ
ncbi:hypothetical protein OG339_48720 (plasmid) [Streptosporangium sp. NBC_01495]|uniref:hypothetical protein n=1 Tax=Streptosporangium sp. NBC_01495 TaxID=2903899 RepID=UPI002E3383AE|nr:hypothetical protein [Streptosporangium sp. NBC_01495]